MGNRTIERAMARTLYSNFSRSWNREKRLMGKYGKPGFRKPTFAQWFAMHQRDQQMMAESTPKDVQEYLGLDPWEKPPQYQAAVDNGHGDEVAERGVMTIPMIGGDDE